MSVCSLVVRWTGEPAADLYDDLRIGRIVLGSGMDLIVDSDHQKLTRSDGRIEYRLDLEVRETFLIQVEFHLFCRFTVVVIR